MSRPLRVQYPGAWYHVMNRGRRAEAIFLGKKDYTTFIDLLKESVDLWNVRISAFCLLSNHYHLLVQTPDANLSRCMRHINGVYTQRFNRSHHVDGQLFRGRYKSILIDADSYLLELIRYIHRNPIDSGIVKDVDKYPWSSHQGYLSDAKKWDWLYKEFALSMFSDEKRLTRTRYREFVSRESAEDINVIFGKKKLPSMLGSEGFMERMRRMFSVDKRHVEVPESRSLAPEVKRIKEVVCRSYDVDKEALTVTRRGIANEPRNVAIYLMRHLRGDSLDEIGREFGVAKYSSVSSVIERIKAVIAKDRKLRQRVEELKEEINMSQEQT
jgi:putative transposase